MDNQIIKKVLEQPEAVELPAGAAPDAPAWQGQMLGAILDDAAPDEGLRLLGYLANGYSGEMPVKLAAALLLGKHHGWGPYAPVKAAPKKAAKPKAKKADKPVDVLTGTALRAALQIAAKGTRRKAALEVLRHILIKQTEGHLVLTGTDLEIAVRVTLPYGGTPVSVAVPQTIIEAVKGKEPVQIKADGEIALVIESGGKRARLVGIHADAFPVPGTGEPLISTPVDLGVLATVAGAATSDDERPTLQTMFLGRTGHCPECGQRNIDSTMCWRCAKEKDSAPEVQEEQSDGASIEAAAAPDGESETLAAAADGYRMARSFIDLPADWPAVLVPARAVIIASQVIAADAQIALVERFDRNGVPEPQHRVIISGTGRRGEEVEVITLAAPGRFPDIYSIIPSVESAPVSFVVDARALLAAADSLKALAVKANNKVLLSVDGGEATLLAEAKGTGRMVETVPLVQPAARATMMAIDVRYLMAALTSYGDAHALVRFAPPVFHDQHKTPWWQPAVQPAAFEAGPVNWVVMPMHSSGTTDWRPDRAAILQDCRPYVYRRLCKAGEILGDERESRKPNEEEIANALDHIGRERTLDVEAVLEGAGWLDDVRAAARALVEEAVAEANAEWSDQEIEDVVARMIRESCYNPHYAPKAEDVVVQREYEYLLLNRPPGIGTAPDGVIKHEAWTTARTHPSGGNYRHFLGRVTYAERLPLELISRYELWPVDKTERAEMVFWRTNDPSLREDYIARPVAWLRELAKSDQMAAAALVLLGHVDAQGPYWL